MTPLKIKFLEQHSRSDVLKNMLHKHNLNEIITNNGDKINDKSYQGFVYETICIILVITKCLNIIFSKILVGKFEEYDTQQVLKNIKELLDVPIQQGNDIADLTLLTDDNCKIVFSIKYRNKESADIDELGVSKLKLIISDPGREHDKIGLIVKNNECITKHRYNTKKSKSDELLKEIIENKLLLDETDIKNGYKEFKLKLDVLPLKSFEHYIDYINSNYLNNGRKLLVQKLHQAMFRNKIINNIKKGYLCHLIQNKPRSGKTILMLLIAYDLLTSLKKNKILITTSVPSTIKSFIDDLNKWDIFKNIEYKEQTDFLKLKSDFNGICFVSVQYLKNDNEECSKKIQLKKLEFDACIFDESDFGSSTDKTVTDILNFTKSIHNINIFASGTANKTSIFYKIHKTYIYNWDIEDENCMKTIENPENLEFMSNRHGVEFKKNLKESHINKDYSDCPSQVLIQPEIINDMINKIVSYNSKNNTNFGYSISSLLSLKQRKPTKKDKNKYTEKFEICDIESGVLFLKAVLESIISDDPMKETVETYVEKTQSKYNSRNSTRENPRLFIAYLPTGNRKGEIDKLQKTLIKFLNENNLWTNYYLSYSNCYGSSSDSKTDYNDFIKKQMLLTKKQKKKGCILFLGRKGGRGITYEDCDVTISFDDGNILDEQKQRNYRALTSAPKKTIGINVDLNIQRVYYLLSNMIDKFKKINKSQSPSEILHYLTEHEHFIYNPQEVNYTNMSSYEIKNYYEKISTKIKEEIKEDIILDNIECDDILKDYINNSLNTTIIAKQINTDLEGKQKECPKSGEKQTLINSDTANSETANSDIANSDTSYSNNTEAIEEIYETPINITKEFFKKMLPLLALSLVTNHKYYNSIYDVIKKDGPDSISIDYNIKKLINNKYKIEIQKIKLLIIKVMEKINESIEKLEYLYKHASPEQLRYYIEKQYLPSDKERSENAEVPTPVKLVDEMLNTIPKHIFENLNKILEPCCGKGNFVLGIFDMYYKGLYDKYDNKEILCKDIIEKCLYFGDLEANNVTITEKLLTVYASRYSGKIINYKFNSFIGDTLKLNVNDEWDIEHFDMIICNFPFQEKNENGKSKPGKNNLWSKFISYSFKIVKTNGLLLFVTPTSWMNGTVTCFDKMIKSQIHYLNVNDCKKWFVGVGSQFSYYLIENTPIYKDTKVVCEYQNKVYRSSIRLNANMLILPLLLTPEVIDLVNKLFDYSCSNKFIRKDQIKSMPIETNKQIKDDFEHPFITYKKKNGDLDIRYCKQILNNQDFKKVLLFRNGYLNPVYDDGNNGVGNNIHYCIVSNEEEGKQLVDLYDSDIYKFMFSICKYSGYNNGRVMNWLYNNKSIEEIKKKLIPKHIEIINKFMN